MTGFTAPVFYRHTLTESVGTFLRRGVIPFRGGLMVVTWIFMPAYFRGQTLPERTAEQMAGYVVPEELRD